MSVQTKPPTGIVSIHGREYETVALRVQRFHAERPGHRIVTKIIFRDDQEVVMRAAILSEQGHVLATGHAEERRSSSQINRTSALENCETSAIGRALAAAGMGGTEFASANEVANATHQQSPPKAKSERSPAAPAPPKQPPATKPPARPKPTKIDFDHTGQRTTPIWPDEQASSLDHHDFMMYYASQELPKPGAGLATLLKSVVEWQVLQKEDRAKAVEALKNQDASLAENYAAIAWCYWQASTEIRIQEIKQQQITEREAEAKA